MKKTVKTILHKITIITFLLVFLFAAAPLSVAKAEIKGYEIKKMDTPPVIDGVLNQEEWGDKVFTVADGAENVNVLAEGGTGVLPAPLTADIYLGYDASKIYICAVATYDDHKNEVLLPSDLWQGDCMQIQISGAQGTDRNEIGFSYNSVTNKPMTVAWASTGNFALEEGKDYNVVRDGKVTTYEIALPVSAFSGTVTELSDGMQLPFSLSFHMNAGGFYEFADGIVQNKDITKAAIFGLGVEPEVVETVAPAEPQTADADTAETEEAQAPESAAAQTEETAEAQTEEASVTETAETDTADTAETQEAVETSAAADEDTQSGNSTVLIIVIIAAVVVICGLAVFFTKKKNKAK